MHGATFRQKQIERSRSNLKISDISRGSLKNWFSPFHSACKSDQYFFEGESKLESAMANGMNKAQFNAFGEHAPFAVRGLLGKDKFNQVKGYKTIAQSRIRSGSSPLPTHHNAPIGTSRGLHAGRALSGPAVNRPLSPHLPLKKPQFSATFSISHRIFGMALGTAIMLTPLAYKFSLQFDV